MSRRRVHLGLLLGLGALALLCIGITRPDAQACTQTFGPGNNAAIVAAVTSAATGSTICLNNGTYGPVTFSGILRTGFVTVKSTSGIGASMSPQVDNSRFIKFQSLTLGQTTIAGCSQNIQVLSSTWTQNTDGIYVNDLPCGGPGPSNRQILIDGNTMVQVRPGGPGEGKIYLCGVNGVTVSNNLIQGEVPGRSGFGADGIQTCGTGTNITIGPGNIFRDLLQSVCGPNTATDPHCDAIQYVGECLANCAVTGNWFDNVTSVLQHHDGSSAPIAWTDNLHTNAEALWSYSPQAGGSRFEHNTFYNIGAAAWAWCGGGYPGCSSFIGRSNVILGNGGPGTENCSGCTFTHNLCQTAGLCGFNTSNTTVATPIFVGGLAGSITTYAGYQLTAASAGKGTAHDGLDRGIRFSSTPTPPAAPGNLRITSGLLRAPR